MILFDYFFVLIVTFFSIECKGDYRYKYGAFMLIAFFVYIELVRFCII